MNPVNTKDIIFKGRCLNLSSLGYMRLRVGVLLEKQHVGMVTDYLISCEVPNVKGHLK